MTCAYFNSIKVRLEQDSDNENNHCQEFQFHKGAIRTIKDLDEKMIVQSFQFHKGAIRTHLS